VSPSPGAGGSTCPTTRAGSDAGPRTSSGSGVARRGASSGGEEAGPSPSSGGGDALEIAGLTALSTCDWPGRLVATLFLQGCPWECTYCHNPSLIDPRTPGTVPWTRVRGLLARRHGLLDGVVFSGGEPTRQHALVGAVREVRDARYLVGLHTSGAYPRRLAQVLPHVDWVGLDLKAPASLYRAVTGVGTSGDAAFASLRLVLDSGVAVQVRTTIDPTVLAPDDVARLRSTLRGLGVRDHVLQEVRPEGTTDAYRAALAAVRAAATGAGPTPPG
jgi:pyruvate formate lyase activating enzyme